MKRLTIIPVAILTAAAMLTSCGITETGTETTENSAPAATSAETSVPVTETEKTETSAVSETVTSAKSTAVSETVTSSDTSAAETAATSEEYESEIWTTNIDKVPTEEQAALDKLRAKYGKDFSFKCREVQWEFIGEPIPEKKPTTYILEDDEGREFYAYGTEDSDEITADNYVYALYADELFEHASEYIRSYTQAGKLWVSHSNMNWKSFETPAEMTYEEFFSYFCEQKGSISAYILLPEGTVLPTELAYYDTLDRNDLPWMYLDDFGCRINLGLYYLNQSDYDSIEDVIYYGIDIDRSHMRASNESHSPATRPTG